MSRFHEPQDRDFVRINTSIDFDQRLWPQDIEGSRAHAKMLAACGIITDDDRDALLSGLERVWVEFEEGRFEFVLPVHSAPGRGSGAVDDGAPRESGAGSGRGVASARQAPPDEDIHMAIERRLIEIVGSVGGKLHTARSRNDQVATDLILFTRTRAREAKEAVGRLMGVLLERAEEHLDWPLPGYTHLQRAQPVYLSHHLLAYFWMLARDRERFAFAESQCARLPLGAGALAGVNFDTDRELVARELGFSEPAPNSIDAVSNRDFALDYLSAAAICATHLSRLGAELVLWSSAEFGFCELPDSWSAGSSIMPQKKNPDAAELLRAKAPRVVAHLGGLHGVLHALPLTYNKDLQEDKEHLFDAADTLELELAAARGMLAGVSFDRGRMEQAAGDELIAATDVADLLVRRGLPFREAHGVVAALVRLAVDSDRQLSELTPKELCAQSELLDDTPEGAGEYYKVLARDSWLESKTSLGGTALPRVREQMVSARATLEQGAGG
ncbi:MAG: argininosuccinate lyase [Solirubrobacteraceae bacterium]